MNDHNTNSAHSFTEGAVNTPTPCTALEGAAQQLDIIESQADRDGRPYRWQPAITVREAAITIVRLKRELAEAKEQAERNYARTNTGETVYQRYIGAGMAGLAIE